MELEFTFCPYYFEDDEAERNAPIMTDFLRDVRRLADETAAARGRPLEIGARILPTREGNLAQGLDVAAWIQDGLLDFVAPTIYQDHQVDANLPFEWLVDLADGTDCHVYPTLQRAVRGLDIADNRFNPGSLELHASIEQLRAGAASFWDRGADGIFMLFLKWPHGPEQRTIFTEAHDPDLLRRSPRATSSGDTTTCRRSSATSPSSRQRWRRAMAHKRSVSTSPTTRPKPPRPSDSVSSGQPQSTS